MGKVVRAYTIEDETSASMPYAFFFFISCLLRLWVVRVFSFAQSISSVKFAVFIFVRVVTFC